MIRYLFRRAGQAVAVLWIVTSATFVLIHLAPGGPAVLSDPKLTPVERAAIERHLGIDRPLAEQYLVWHRNLLRGDLGRSFLYQRPAGATVLARVPNTLLLAGLALAVGLALALPLGVRAGRRPDGPLARIADLGSFVALAIPPFWFGIVLILVFAATLRLLPAGGAATPGLEGSLLDRLRHLILPVAVLALPISSELFRFARSAVREALRAPHVAPALARGLAERLAVRRHVVRNALLPVATIVGLQAPLLAGGAAITETVFAWPGMGRLGVEAAIGRDYPVVMAITLLVALVVVSVNLALDLAYRWIDPRFGER
ncbi:MAG: ABC transporter permease [Gemmatimonadales bacterium]